MAIDPATAIANAISEVAATLRMAFNGKNRQLLADVKRVKNMKKALDIAEAIFLIADPRFYPKERHLKYWKLRDRFNRKD